MKILALSPLLMSMVLAGCATSPSKGSDGEDKDAAVQLLVKSAQNISSSLTLLSEAEQFEKMKQNPNQPRIYKQVAGMEQMVTMPWHGTLEQAVSKLASYSGFEVKFMGKPPVTPILIQIGANPATVSDHMRNLGIQAGNRADVIIDPAQKIVEVRYSNGGV